MIRSIKERGPLIRRAEYCDPLIDCWQRSRRKRQMGKTVAVDLQHGYVIITIFTKESSDGIALSVAGYGHQVILRLRNMPGSHQNTIPANEESRSVTLRFASAIQRHQDCECWTPSLGNCCCDAVGGSLAGPAAGGKGDSEHESEHDQQQRRKPTALGLPCEGKTFPTQLSRDDQFRLHVLARRRISISSFITSCRLPLPSFVPNASCSVL